MMTIIYIFCVKDFSTHGFNLDSYNNIHIFIIFLKIMVHFIIFIYHVSIIYYIIVLYMCIGKKVKRKKNGHKKKKTSFYINI